MLCTCRSPFIIIVSAIEQKAFGLLGLNDALGIASAFERGGGKVIAIESSHVPEDYNKEATSVKRAKAEYEQAVL